MLIHLNAKIKKIALSKFEVESEAHHALSPTKRTSLPTGEPCPHVFAAAAAQSDFAGSLASGVF